MAEGLLASENTYEVVLSCYKCYKFPVSGLAELPVVLDGLVCGLCGEDEGRGEVIVCDGCERGFHVDCVGIGGEEAAEVDEWVCKGCRKRRKRGKLWSFGSKSKRKRLRGCSAGDSIGAKAMRNYPEGSAATSETIAVDDEVGASPVKVSKKQYCMNVDDELPLQYADFFVISAGKIDVRSTYHCPYQIWPVGFKSCWHDSITGSLFVSEVLDGGDPGPHFRVRRFPCCQSSIPIATTLLSDTAHGLSDGQEETDGCLTTNKYDYDEYDSVVPMLADPCLPTVDDFLAPIGSGFDEFRVSQLSEHVHQRTKPVVEESKSNDLLELRDEVGELLVEESSSFVAWRSMARAFLNSCHEIVLRSGCLKLACPHLAGGTQIGCHDRLLKFVGTSLCLSIPPLITKEKLDSLSGELFKWLEEDRFGLSENFVQEIVEKLPDAHSSANYIFLNQRDLPTSSITVQSGTLNANIKGGVDAYQIESRCLPLGKPIHAMLSPSLCGDVFQVWQFLCRFCGILGLDSPLSFVDLELQLIDPWVGHSDPRLESVLESGSMVLPERTAFLSKVEYTNYFLTKVHTSLLQVLLGELESKLVAIIEPCDDAGDMKRKRGRKKDVDSLLASKVKNFRTLPLNEFTWPELARRYLLAISLLDGNMNSANWTYDTISRVLHCLRGDGGILCGSLGGVAAIGVDALILADAARRIFGCVNRESDMLGIGGNVPDGNNSCGNGMSEAVLPDWAEVLVPVQKLPTNVGSRIRNCVRQALEKGPPEWAREILENSISKEVYKSNASGPTKRAAIAVLSQALGEAPQPIAPPAKKLPSAMKRREKYISISSIMMKQCRVVLREAASADNKKVFCYLMGRRLQNCGSDDGILGSRAVVSRPLDFRTIDIRLAAGAYHGSHEAFLEDARELWMTIRTTYRDQPDLLQMAHKLSSNFESLYEQKVNVLYRELIKYSKLKTVSVLATKQIEDLLHSVSAVDIPKAPWNKGICKVCGINRDDKRVLLCDECDGEYHTYCLNPPLTKIPGGNWFCPFCISQRHPFKDTSTISLTIHELRKKGDGKYTRRLFEMIDCLSNTMGKTDYWELSLNERVCLLQFLCDDMLTSSAVRQHLETCSVVRDNLNTKLHTPSDVKTTLHSPSKYKTMLHTPSEYKAKLRSPSAYKTKNLKEEPASSQCSDRCSSDISEGDKKAVEGKKVKGFHRSSVSVSMDHSEAQSGDSGLYSNKSDSQLQQIFVHDKEVQKEVSLRNKCLGFDSAGRLYWTMVTPGNQISVVVNENKLQGGKTIFASAQDMSSNKGGSMDGYRSLEGSNVPCPFTHQFSHEGYVSSSWVVFESDVEINGLCDFLKDDHHCERQLRDSILKWQSKFSKRRRFGKQEVGSQFSSPLSQNFLQSDCSMNRAVNLLQSKYGSFVEPKAKSSSMLKGKAVGLDGMYRCECLEPVWPSRLHCSSCHKTFLLKVDFKVHDCQSAILVPVEDALEGKGTMNSGNGQEKYLDNRINTCPESDSNSTRSNHCHSDVLATPNLADVCSKFVTEGSNLELVKAVGLLSSNGVPSFVPLESPYFSDPALKLDNYLEDARFNISGDLPNERIDLSMENVLEAHANATLPQNSPKHSVVPEADGGSASFPNYYRGNLFTVPDTSLRPLVGRASEVLRRMKTQLLDMDAALPEAALRASKSLVERRWVWRSFVKSAQAIYEVVQAMVVLEDSIKAEYLSDTWIHWSSLSAAAKISTLSALALRIYSLDAAIQYERTSPKELSSKKQKKREKSSPDKTSNKKIKEDNQKGNKE